jgi:hypothetical protein
MARGALPGPDPSARVVAGQAHIENGAGLLAEQARAGEAARIDLDRHAA